MFVEHSLETAPSRSRPWMEGTLKKLGFLPSPTARLAASPSVLEAFARSLMTFDRSSLGELEREVLVFTVARHNQCHYCVALHSSLLAGGPHTDLVPALREGAPLPDAKLEALRRFVLAMLEGRGEVNDAELSAFSDAGFTAEQALDVALGIATYTLSTFANRLTRAPLDAHLERFRW